MLCDECGYRIPYITQPDDPRCIVCGTNMTPTMDDAFKDNKYGVIKEIRDAQFKYANDVQTLLRQHQKGVALLEGSTGIGKSYAYLIPAILTNKRIIISTATTALQDQLAIDIPILLQKMGSNRSFAEYKGKKNYACRFASKNIKNKKEKKQFEEWINAAERYECPAKLVDWLGPKPPWWDDITTDDCPNPKKCEHRSYCRPHPVNYDLLVINHSILAIDLFLGEKPMHLLSNYDLVVLDEGHKAPSYFRSVFTHNLTYKGTHNLKATYDNSTPLQTTVLLLPTRFSVDAISIGLATIKRTVSELLTQAGCTPKLDYEKAITLEAETIENLTVLLEIIKRTTVHVDTLIAYLNTDSVQSRLRDSGELDTALAGVSRAKHILRGLNGMLRTVNNLIHANPEEDLVTIDTDGLYVQPVDLGKVVAPGMAAVPFKIITSATIKTGENFDYIREQLGIQESECVYKSTYTGVFDYDTQARLYLPPTVPLPAYFGEERIKWIQGLVYEIQRLILGTKGDALVLFSAIKDMDETWDALNHARLKNQGLRLLRQGGRYGMDAGSALNAYKKNRGSVLFGVKSLWEGIDLPGDQLRMVIITKLPFPFESPLHKVLKTRLGKDVMFNKIVLPAMITDIRQGAGRPLRTQTDRAVIAILDPRMWTGRTKDHYDILRDMRKSDDPKDKGLQGYGKDIKNALGIRNRAVTFEDAIDFANRK